ncbi:MAG: GAF domain-containing protein, partial [Anaerolineae bacterium]|nr:GAF domain-containing protein [Anaerolineae bacterium]
HQLSAGKGLVGRSAQLNALVVVPDTEGDPDWLPNPLLPGTRAEVAVPISYGGEVLGVLDVQHDVRGGLGADDAALLESVAGQVAVALQNARLLQETEERAKQAAVMNVISQRIQRATSVDEVLQVATRELALALNSERARVQLHSPGQATKGNGQTAAFRQAKGEESEQ